MGNLFGGIFGKKQEQDVEDMPEYKPTKGLTLSINRTPTINTPKMVGSYGLTPLGRAKVKQLEDNDPNFIILATIEENGPLSLGMISERVGYSVQKCSHLIRGRYGLVASGALKVVGPQGE